MRLSSVRIAALLCVALPAAAQDPLLPRITQRLQAIEPALVAFRRDLHRHPEPSGAERRTARQVAARLRALGLDVRTNVGGHGVVARLRGGRPGPVVAFRADLDAVRTTDADPVPFRSTVAGVRHVCGHDVHTTIGIALADALHAVRRELPGEVLFIFQPAEERGTGAEAMLSDGLFREVTPAAIYAVHTAPFPVGVLGTISGDLMTGRDAYRVLLRGRGDLPAAARVVQQRLDALGTVTVAQAMTPTTRDLVLIESRFETDADSGRLVRGTIMSTSLSRPRVEAAMAELRALTLPNVTVTVDYRPKVMAGVTNDPALTPRAVAAVTQTLGPTATLEVSQIIPGFSEDFGAFQAQVPGVFFFLGVSNPARGTVGMPHAPDYVADEGAIVVGARAIAAVLLDRLRQ